MSENQAKNDGVQVPDPITLGKAILDAYEKAQPIFEDYINKYSSADAADEFSAFNFDPMNVRETYLEFLDQIAQKPEKYFEIQAEFMQDWITLWQSSVNRFMGDGTQAPQSDLKPDRRFKSAEWQESALFDFIKNSYLLTCRHVEKTIGTADGLSDKQKEKLQFQAKLLTDAMSPTNFAMTNPDVIKETMKTGGQNLVKGFENLLNDLKRGHGDLNISTTKYDAFELGKNIAVTKGEVIYQNDLMQLIQYAPKTKDVFQIPLLVVPPWINKYYILDLREGNSLIEWLVEQGHTVFTVSWVNPTAKLATKQFEDYMLEGMLEAINQIQKATKEERVNIIGYCLGGTLLATTLAYLTKKKKADCVASATFLTTLLDFDLAGDMKLFLDDEQLENLEKMMGQHGILQGKELQRTFSLMRANDLIWSFVVNNYLLGKEPFPFDLLYWNDDCTNMPAAMHSFYLRNMYRDNKLIEVGGITIDGVDIDLSKIKTPCHFISAKEDHIAPWVATYAGIKHLSGDVTFTLAASGHIAGVVNPPAKNKYCYWVNKESAGTPESWLENATEHAGSWWPHWQKWITPRAGKNVTARSVKKGIEAAPGSYVKVRG